MVAFSIYQIIIALKPIFSIFLYTLFYLQKLSVTDASICGLLPSYRVLPVGGGGWVWKVHFWVVSIYEADSKQAFTAEFYVSIWWRSLIISWNKTFNVSDPLWQIWPGFNPAPAGVHGVAMFVSVVCNVGHADGLPELCLKCATYIQ